MRIGIISDTHVPEARRDIPRDVFRFFDGVDLILHAGDLHVVEVLDWLEVIAPVKGVRGNGDDGGSGRPLVPEDPRLEETQILDVGGFRIGMMHTLPWYMEYPHPLAEAVARRFGTPVDIVIHGDTHVAEVERREGVLLINPGSPSLPNNLMPRPGTIALLDLADGRAEARLIQLQG